MPNWPIVLLLVLQQWPAADAKLVKLTINLVPGRQRVRHGCMVPAVIALKEKLFPVHLSTTPKRFGVRM